MADDRRQQRRHRQLRGLFGPERMLEDRQNPLEVYSRSECYEKFRFFPETILFICGLVGNLKSTPRNKALTTLQSVCVVLRFLACGSFYACFGDMVQASKSTVCREVNRVIPILASLVNRFVLFPTGRKCIDVKKQFQERAGFPDVIGCIDGTLVEIEAPNKREEDYVCRKGFHAINVQICCDAKRMITNIVARWPGSVHDSRIFKESSLCTEFEQGLHRGVLLGDGGYGIRRFLLTPFRNAQTRQTQNYNAAHRTTRTIVEQKIGIFKRRFAAVKYILRVQPDKSCAIILACAVLYNIGKATGMHNDDDDDDDDDGDDDRANDDAHDRNNTDSVDEERTRAPNAQRMLGQAFRDEIVQMYFSN